MEQPVTGRARARRESVPGWREDALRSMLGVAAIVAPPASVLAVVAHPPPRPLLDYVVILSVGVTMPLLRYLPRLPFAVRASSTMAIMFGAGIFSLQRYGLAPGVVLLFAVTSTLGALYFGRAVAFAVVGLGAAAILAVGYLVTHGVLRIPPDIFGPEHFQNWFRVGMIYALIATLLTSGVTFVMGRVEASARDLRVAYERLGQLHLRLESAKEQERRFLAHELHDELGQLLTALKLRIQLAARAPAGLAEPDTIAVVDDLISRVRRMSGDLRPPLLDEVGLVPALRAYLDSQAVLSGVSMTLDADEPVDDAYRLDADLEITCFRIVQEAVTNALRHADARDLRVELDRHADRVSLRIRDDGRGFDVAVRLESAAAAGHLGVVGMRERVRAHGGGFRLHSRPGAGTTIEVDLPLLRAGLGGSVGVPS